MTKNNNWKQIKILNFVFNLYSFQSKVTAFSFQF